MGLFWGVAKGAIAGAVASYIIPKLAGRKGKATPEEATTYVAAGAALGVISEIVSSRPAILPEHLRLRVSMPPNFQQQPVHDYYSMQYPGGF
jgi:hypothetical protein